jgi:hypothetical protein
MTDFIDSDGNGNPIAAPIETPYDAKRSMEYPNISEQLDMIWHELNDNGTLTDSGEWFTTIRDVKQRHPKS